MFIYFIHTLLAYSRVVAWLWQRERILIFSLGLLYAVGMFFLFGFIYEYEEVITSYIVEFLETFLSISMKDKLAFSNSFPFFLGIFSYRTCLLVLIVFVLQLGILTLLLPLYYWVGLRLTNRLLGTHTPYSFARLGSMYASLVNAMFYKGTWTMLYLFVLFCLSFFPYIGILCAVASFLVISHFLGFLFSRLSHYTANFNWIAVEPADMLKTSLLVGAFVVLSFLLPVVGWVFIPLIHIPASVLIFQSLPNIKT